MKKINTEDFKVVEAKKLSETPTKLDTKATEDEIKCELKKTRKRAWRNCKTRCMPTINTAF